MSEGGKPLKTVSSKIKFVGQGGLNMTCPLLIYVGGAETEPFQSFSVPLGFQ